jgi:hypothetical protein
MINVKYLLNEIGQNEENNSIAKIFGANVFAVGSEMLVLEILENLERSHLIISVIGLRSLLENYINVHYIYHHPVHLKDDNWSVKICKDFLERTLNPHAIKSKTGDKSLFKRAKELGLEDLYTIVYSDLCNFSHFLANITDIVYPYYFKGKTIETCIYTITFYQDILIAISTFYGASFDVFIDDILLFKKKGKEILSSINVKKEYLKFKEYLKNFKTRT